jgi:hypothetical protein
MLSTSKGEGAMFGSQILEVAIGLIMVFLLVSLILTAVRETIEAWFRTRARDLERAIAELLDDHTGDGLRKKLYEHPLIYGLFQGPVSLTDFADTGAAPPKAAAAAAPASDPAPQGSDPTKVAAAEGEPADSQPFQRTDATKLPSYIPRETFALALEHLLAEGKGSGRIALAYAALKRAAGDHPALIRKGIEDWYDAAMDRASGWYRRRTQRILFWLGLAVALLLNINAFTIAQYLSTSDAARQQVVALGDAYLKDPAVVAAMARPQDSAGGGGGDSTAEAGAQAPGNEAAVNLTAADDGTGNAGAATTNGSAGAGSASPDGNAAVPTTAGSAGGDEATSARQLTQISQNLQRELVQAGLPIGWNAVQMRRVHDQLTGQGGLAGLGFLVMLVAGYLAVGFAATMGAPFWFDLLGKFMVVRSTVKPKEKSPDEASKDGGTGGSPVKPKSGGGGNG